jgi:hypothetical protein
MSFSELPVEHAQLAGHARPLSACRAEWLDATGTGEIGKTPYIGKTPDKVESKEPLCLLLLES